MRSDNSNLLCGSWQSPSSENYKEWLRCQYKYTPMHLVSWRLHYTLERAIVTNPASQHYNTFSSCLFSNSNNKIEHTHMNRSQKKFIFIYFSYFCLTGVIKNGHRSKLVNNVFHCTEIKQNRKVTPVIQFIHIFISLKFVSANLCLFSMHTHTHL